MRSKAGKKIETSACVVAKRQGQLCSKLSRENGSSIIKTKILIIKDYIKNA